MDNQQREIKGSESIFVLSDAVWLQEFLLLPIGPASRCCCFFFIMCLMRKRCGCISRFTLIAVACNSVSHLLCLSACALGERAWSCSRYRYVWFFTSVASYAFNKRYFTSASGREICVCARALALYHKPHDAWGHKTTDASDMCLQEGEANAQTSKGPQFINLLGNLFRSHE